MNSFPTVLVAGIQNSKPETIIKLILGDDRVTAQKEGNLSSYSWKISNKYYSTEVQFLAIIFEDDSPTVFPNSVEAVIVFFDNILENFLAELHKLNNSFTNMKPEIQILVCGQSVPETEKKIVEDWCVENKYELVELDPVIEDKSEDDFGECFGIARVVEILHSHQWSNLILNDETSVHRINDPFSSIDVKFPELENKYSQDSASNQSYDEIDSEKSLDDVEQLSALFQNLATMKQNISSLDGESKLKQAEKVVKAFWEAMNGDSDEFSESENEA